MAIIGPKWQCSTCGRKFARTGQRHACGDWTVEGHLEGKPQHVVALFEQFSRLVEQSGPFEYAPVRNQIGFQVARIFAGVSLTHKRLHGYLDIARKVENPRFYDVAPYTKRLFVHHFRITSQDQLDDEFAGWIDEAYAVGTGAHRERS